MKSFITLLLTLVTLAAAYVDFEDWHPAGPWDKRSPCPALNALANHNMLPHNGCNITLPRVIDAFREGLNVSEEVAKDLFGFGLSLSKDPASGAFHLDDLNKHNAVEHDASLSRKDYNLGGESQAFSPEVFNQTLSFYNGAQEIGIKEVADARWGRVQSSNKTNPKFVYGDAQHFPSYFESSSYFQLFVNAKTQKAPVELIKVFFEQERLPYKEGWRPINHIDGFSTANYILQIAMHTPEKAPGVGF